jgi:hypothetical protein
MTLTDSGVRMFQAQMGFPCVSPGKGKMEEFVICPNCQDLDSRRTKCSKCGYGKERPRQAPDPSNRRSESSNVGCWSRFIGICIGVGCFSYAWQDWRVSQGTADNPTAVEVKALEAGERPPQNYVLLGKHVRLYPLSVYVSPKREERDKNPSVRKCFFPIVSVGRLVEDIPPVDRREGPPADRPPARAFQPPRFSVLAMTEEYKRLADIPTRIAAEGGLEGMVVNSIYSLDPKVVALLREEYPSMDPEKIVIVEVGRKPGSPWMWIIVSCIGACFLFGVAAAFWEDFRRWTRRLLGMIRR